MRHAMTWLRPPGWSWHLYDDRRDGYLLCGRDVWAGERSELPLPEGKTCETCLRVRAAFAQPVEDRTPYAWRLA